MRKSVKLLVLTHLLVFFCPACVVKEEYVIPDDFVTYDDPDGLYSISLPGDWVVDLDMIQQMEGDVDDYLAGIDEGISLDKSRMLFMAVLPNSDGPHPSVGITIEPNQGGAVQLRTMLRSEINGLKAVAQDYDELLRKHVFIGGREVYILEFIATLSDLESVHVLLMMTMNGATTWTVGCTLIGSLDDYAAFEDDFHAIVRSLRIHE